MENLRSMSYILDKSPHRDQFLLHNHFCLPAAYSVAFMVVTLKGSMYIQISTDKEIRLSEHLGFCVTIFYTLCIFLDFDNSQTFRRFLGHNALFVASKFSLTI